MQVRTPDYYLQFKCIAGACTDSCCAGWQVDVDDRSYAYYETVTGEFGDRLRSVMIKGKRGAEGRFRIGSDGRCPFLNENNLCDLYTALGEDALCTTCEMYPRYVTDFGNTREMGIALSCVTAAELIMGQQGEKGFVEHEDEDLFLVLNDIDGLFYINMLQAREKVYGILWNRDINMADRLDLLLDYAKLLEAHRDNPECFAGLDAKMPSAIPATDAAKSYGLFWKYYLKQAIIKKEWALTGMKALELLKKGEFDCKAIPELLEQYSSEFENIATYFVYRYFLQAVFDNRITDRIKMCVVSILMILQSYYVDSIVRQEEPDFDRRVWLTHVYSRELEHSEENFARLLKILGKKKVFSADNLISLLLLT